MSLQNSAISIDELRDLTRGNRGGTVDVACPLCGPSRKHAVNRHRKVLRIWDNGEGFFTYNCERCGAAGYAKEEGSRATVKQPRPAATPPKPDTPDKSELARLLWRRSLPSSGTLAESYLRSRHCWIESDNLRYLSARGNHPASMIARFGTGIITGIHLTKIAADGSGKAGTEKDKIMIGPSKGQPIIVHDNAERGELIISEGIEDAASWAIATGWSSWAAGSAGRIPAVLAQAGSFEKVFISLDKDEAGERALQEARQIRADLITVDCAHYYGSTVSIDANRSIKESGQDYLLRLIARAEAQHDFQHGRLTPNEFMRLTR